MGDKKYKQKHIELGLCANCSEPAYRGMKLCLKHIRSHNASNRNHRVANIEKYRAKDRVRNQRRIANGQCVTCSALLDPDADSGRTNCVNCRGKIHNERYINGTTIV